MPYIGVESGDIFSTVSIAFGTVTAGIAGLADFIMVSSRNNDGTIDTSDNTSVVTLSYQGIASLVIGSSTLTVSSGTATTSLRGKSSGQYTIIATSPGKDTGTFTGKVNNNAAMYLSNELGGFSSPASGGGGGGATLLRDTIKIDNQTLYRLILWDVNTTNRGRGNIAAIIHDAKNIGVSAYLNEGGEIFFTLPYNHPQISACVPLERHYRVDRFDEEEGRYVAIGQGLLEDYEATDNEVVFYGIDYMNVLYKTITTPSTTQTLTYTSKTFGEIYQNEMTQAISAPDSRLGFISYNLGTAWTHTASYPLVINPSTNTYSVYTGGEPRMSFLSNLANIVMAGTTTKVVFGNTLESDTELYNGFFCDMNWSPTQNNNIVLEYGGNIKSFSYSPNLKNLITRSLLVATNSGANVSKIWSSTVTGTAAPTSTYGRIDAVATAEDIKTQAAADARASYNLYQSSPEKLKMITVAIKDGSIVPFKRYKLGDDIRVRIQRGIVDVDANITLRGQQYVGRSDGSEELWFDFFIKDALQFNLYQNDRRSGNPSATETKPLRRRLPASVDSERDIRTPEQPSNVSDGLAPDVPSDQADEGGKGRDKPDRVKPERPKSPEKIRPESSGKGDRERRVK